MSLQPCMTFSSLKHPKRRKSCCVFCPFKSQWATELFWTPLTFTVWTKTFFTITSFVFCKRKTVIEVWNDKNTFNIIIYIIIVYSNLWFDHRWIKITDFLLRVNFPLKYPSPFTAMVLIGGCFKISFIIFCYLIWSKIFEKYSNCTIWL